MIWFAPGLLFMALISLSITEIGNCVQLNSLDLQHNELLDISESIGKWHCGVRFLDKYHL